MSLEGLPIKPSTQQPSSLLSSTLPALSHLPPSPLTSPFMQPSHVEIYSGCDCYLSRCHHLQQHLQQHSTTRQTETPTNSSPHRHHQHRQQHQQQQLLSFNTPLACRSKNNSLSHYCNNNTHLEQQFSQQYFNTTIGDTNTDVSSNNPNNNANNNNGTIHQHFCQAAHNTTPPDYFHDLQHTIPHTSTHNNRHSSGTSDFPSSTIITTTCISSSGVSTGRLSCDVFDGDLRSCLSYDCFNSGAVSLVSSDPLNGDFECNNNFCTTNSGTSTTIPSIASTYGYATTSADDTNACNTHGNNTGNNKHTKNKKLNARSTFKNTNNNQSNNSFFNSNGANNVSTTSSNKTFLFNRATSTTTTPSTTTPPSTTTTHKTTNLAPNNHANSKKNSHNVCRVEREGRVCEMDEGKIVCGKEFEKRRSTKPDFLVN